MDQIGGAELPQSYQRLCPGIKRLVQNFLREPSIQVVSNCQCKGSGDLTQARLAQPWRRSAPLRRASCSGLATGASMVLRTKWGRKQ